VNSKHEQKFDSLPQLGFDPATFSTPVRLSDRSAKSHALLFGVDIVKILLFCFLFVHFIFYSFDFFFFS
jgi:hypothetical protein